EYCVSKSITGNMAANHRNGGKEEYLFDDLLYKGRYVIERTNAWLDAFKAILIRFETNKKTLESIEFNSFFYDFITTTLNNLNLPLNVSFTFLKIFMLALTCSTFTLIFDPKLFHCSRSSFSL
ncbi:MAG: hypothetical protein ACYDEC_17830, partial [Bacteroidia bacterium]